MKTPPLLLTSLVLALFGFASPARAATVITAGTDAELRAAVAACGSITFTFDGVITLTNTINVTCAVTIDATGHAVTISGGNSNRIFNVLPGASLEIVNLTVANGWVRGTNGLPGTPATFGSQPGQSVVAGGVFVTNATLIASDCVFKNCRAIGGTGGDWPAGFAIQYPAGAGGVGSGGAIAARNSSVALQNCFFISNSTTAGFSGVAYRQNGTVFDPARIGEAFGGAIDATGGTVTSTNCQFSKNTSTTRGGALLLQLQTNGVLHQNTFVQNGSGRGGAFTFTGQALLVTQSSFQQNQGPLFGGAVELDGGTATFADCDFFGNQSTSAGSGGALGQATGASTFSRCTFRENSASLRGGAIYCAQGTLELNNCTLALNSLSPGGSTVGRGGAIASEGGLQSLSSCTIASNRISGGSASSQGGGVYVVGGYFDVLNSLLQGNTVNGSPSNWFGANFSDNGHNLSSDSTPALTGGGSSNRVNALLLPLANNGGPTLTMPLRVGSPALNAADPGNFPTTDQRGFARPQGAGPDAGAWEGAGGQVSLRVQRQPGFPQLNTLSWPTDTGVTYRVERAATLNNWNVLATNIAGTGAQVNYNVTNTGAAYFRVATEP